MTQFSSQQILRQNHPDLTEAQVNQLVSVAGDHTATEAEWVQACLLLGNRHPELPRKRRNRRLALIVGSVALVSAGGLWLGISKNVDTNVDHFFTANNLALPSGGMPIPPESSPAPGVTLAPATKQTGPAVAGDVNFTDYMSDLQIRIKQFWRPGHSNASRHTTVLFKLNREGELSDLRVKNSSGVDTADAAALKAVEAAAPFDHLPPGADESVDIQFTFDYNVFK